MRNTGRILLVAVSLAILSLAAASAKSPTLVASPAWAPPAPVAMPPYVVRNDDGGDIGEYAGKYHDLLQMHVPIKFDGYCASSCIIAIGIYPPSMLCATPNAIFGFHGVGNGHDANLNARAAKEFFPPKVAAWYATLRFDRDNDPIWRRATDIGVQPCK